MTTTPPRIAFLDTSWLISYHAQELWTPAGRAMLDEADVQMTIPGFVAQEYTKKQAEGVTDDCGNPVRLPDIDSFSRNSSNLEIFERGKLEEQVNSVWKKTPKGQKSKYATLSGGDQDVMVAALSEARSGKQVHVAFSDSDIRDTLDKISREEKLAIVMITPGRIPLKYYAGLKGSQVMTTPALRQLREVDAKYRTPSSDRKVYVLFQRARMMGVEMEIGYEVQIVPAHSAPSAPPRVSPRQVLFFPEVEEFSEIVEPDIIGSWAQQLFKKNHTLHVVIYAEKVDTLPIIGDIKIREIPYTPPAGASRSERRSSRGMKDLQWHLDTKLTHRVNQYGILYDGLETIARKMLLEQGITLEHLLSRDR